jgi:rhodanese-related sulfurtransferase/DNA-binding transcriptional ArsR family regulator
VATSPRHFKDVVYEQLARVGKAMAAPKRLELLDLLAQGPRTVEALAKLSALSLANASHHLKVLRGARLVATEKRGLYVEYRLADEDVGRFVLTLRRLAQARLAEIDQFARAYLDERGAIETVDSAELLRRVRDGEVTIVDVRPAEEFRAGHVRGALSIPLAELAARLSELPKRRAVVAYCRGPYCVLSIEAVQLLRARGFRAHRLEQGLDDLRERGWKIERPPPPSSRGSSATGGH